VPVRKTPGDDDTDRWLVERRVKKACIGVGDKPVARGDRGGRALVGDVELGDLDVELQRRNLGQETPELSRREGDRRRRRDALARRARRPAFGKEFTLGIGCENPVVFSSRAVVPLRIHSEHPPALFEIETLASMAAASGNHYRPALLLRQATLLG
jgi:hypothetical protein